jgi:fucose permease
MREKPKEEEKKAKGCDAEVIVLILASISLGIYVGCETGFGSFILVYSKWNNDYTEANGQYLSSLFWVFITTGRLMAIYLATVMKETTMLTI